MTDPIRQVIAQKIIELVEALAADEDRRWWRVPGGIPVSVVATPPAPPAVIPPEKGRTDATTMVDSFDVLDRYTRASGASGPTSDALSVVRPHVLGVEAPAVIDPKE